MSTLRSSASGQTLRIQGLAELLSDLGKANKDAKKEVVNGLKDVAKVVADEAARTIVSKGLVDTGQLLRKMQSRSALSATQQGVFVKSTAKRDGFLYGAIYEYGGRAVSLKRKGPGMTAVTNRSKRRGSRGISGAALAASGPALGMFGELGPRAFLWPSVLSSQAATQRAIEKWMDTFLSNHNL